MQQDLRTTPLYREIVQFCADVRRPGEGLISDAAQLHLAPGGAVGVFTATIAEHAEAEPPTRLALIDVPAGDMRLLTDSGYTARMPRFASEGRRVAFLADRDVAGDFQLHLLDLANGMITGAARIAAQLEQLRWSADDRHILLRGVAAAGASSAELPDWLPQLAPSDGSGERRRCWLYDVAGDAVRPLDIAGSVWEAAWAGPERLAVVTSDKSGEDGWYESQLDIVDLSTGVQHVLYRPADQLGPPVVSPDGGAIAVVEGLCSDRGPVIGQLRLIDAATGQCRTANLGGVDAVHCEWRSPRTLLLSGYRGLATVIGQYDPLTDHFEEIWSSERLTITSNCLAGLNDAGDCILVAEGFATAPEVALVRGGRYRAIRSFDIGYAAAVEALASADPIRWPAQDRLEIEGWLLRPAGSEPYPLIALIHGGPLSHWRPGFMIRRLMLVPLLLRRGYALFLPNPRGSTGRGQDFARRVMGDIGGGDARDILDGIDRLVARGIADPHRLGVTGVSYGGFMTAWLVTQTDRFGAAVSVSPHTNQVTAHLLSNIPGFMGRMLGDSIGNLGGRYFDRSPVLGAAQVRTPTLSIGGGLDRCTPADEAAQFHAALHEAGVESALAIYPGEGHGVRRLPAGIDCTARIVGWLIDHLAIEAGT